ncbi:GTPase [Iningainema tapete]|uniref:50S ribosome-binding GTPase n=1 Tax=Iningainema tapete BLCC-T55 TaxID=2748662 RepID=A0A8J7CAC1_9CYAN|nr:GTPase [Iningainema tapete]MBD2771330.1 50S ribosome-binding GTPase [Iningainema tapete BLCC-T55]
MSDNALENLRQIFQDQPELLKVIELGDIESKKLVDVFRESNELFATPVNLYVTGRTGAGKTSLGNCLLEEVKMKSTGYMDCTDSVGFFKLASNLCYFDLPGAGSDGNFENINRAVLLVPQLDEKDIDIITIEEFKKIDYSTPVEEIEIIKVEEWQSEAKQKEVQPDVILYVIAPHMQFLRDDQRYLCDLLKSQLKYYHRNKVVFALNIFSHEKTGEVKHTEQNLEDVKSKITTIFKNVYATKENPPIFEFDAKTGKGVNEITSYICQILPKEKLGNIQQVLRSDLKEFAQKQRSIHYQQTLISIASRLAGYKVDQKAGNQEDLIQVAASAVCSYGVKTFKNQEEIAQIKAELNKIIEDAAMEIKESQTNDIKVIKNITESKEITKERPIIKQEIITDYIEVNEIKVKKLNPFKKVVNTVTTFIGVGKVFEDKIIAEKVKKPIERLETRFLGYEKEVIDTVEAVVGQVEEIVGKEYLQGGYPVIKLILALGRGIQAYCTNSKCSLQDCISEAEVYVECKLAHVEAEIKQLLESIPTQNIEQKLIQIIERELLR